MRELDKYEKALLDYMEGKGLDISLLPSKMQRILTVEEDADSILQYYCENCKKNIPEDKVKLETGMPMFPGFYATLYEPSDEETLDDASAALCERLFGDREHPALETIRDCDPFYYVKFDSESYENSVSRLFADAVNRVIKDALHIPCEVFVSVTGIDHPKEYNFKNDIIDVKLCVENYKAYVTYVYDLLFWGGEYADEFEEYLKKHMTPRDGFIPFYENYPLAWCVDLVTDRLEYPQHRLIMEFLIEHVALVDSTGMYYSVDMSEAIKNYKVVNDRLPSGSAVDEIKRAIKEIDDAMEKYAKEAPHPESYYRQVNAARAQKEHVVKRILEKEIRGLL